MATLAAPERWSGAPAYRAHDNDDWRRHLLQIATAHGGGTPVTASALVATGHDLLMDLLKD